MKKKISPVTTLWIGLTIKNVLMASFEIITYRQHKSSTNKIFDFYFFLFSYSYWNIVF